jgi:hypothetical protein
MYVSQDTYKHASLHTCLLVPTCSSLRDAALQMLLGATDQARPLNMIDSGFEGSHRLIMQTEAAAPQLASYASCLRRYAEIEVINPSEKKKKKRERERGSSRPAKAAFARSQNRNQWYID